MISFGQGYRTLYIGRLNDFENSIFLEGRVFSYNYNIYVGDTVKKVELLLKKEPWSQDKVMTGWKLTQDLNSKNLINEIRYNVVPDSTIRLNGRTNRNQTEVQIEYYYIDLVGGEYTGIVENNRNVWIHPPRGNFFKVLNTCPYPYVQLPLYIGRKWSDKMRISNHWADPNWAIWEKKLKMDLSYEVIGKESISVNDKEYECFVIKSVAISKIGKCELLFYYNEELGFINMRYDILSKIRVHFDLSDVK